MVGEQRGRLIGKSIAYLGGDGAETIFRGRWTDKEATSLHPGTYQVDLIVLYAEGAKSVIEVTAPQYQKMAEQRLRELPLPPGWIRAIHIWGRHAQRPEVVRVTPTAGE